LVPDREKVRARVTILVKEATQATLRELARIPVAFREPESNTAVLLAVSSPHGRPLIAKLAAEPEQGREFPAITSPVATSAA
jgi:hypothetical protein